MQSVYLLWFNSHDRHLLIGVYSDDASARAAMDRIGNKPGFIDHPDGFEISPYEVDRDHWTEGFVVIS